MANSTLTVYSLDTLRWTHLPLRTTIICIVRVSK